MDEQRQQMQKDLRQQKLQQEYKKIERECNKHSCKVSNYCLFILSATSVKKL